MTCEYLKGLMKDPNNIVVDVRTPYEYQQARIDGAMLIPLHELPNSVEHLRDKNVYLYCRSGARSGQGAAWLNAQGIKATNIGGLTNFMGCLAY